LFALSKAIVLPFFLILFKVASWLSISTTAICPFSAFELFLTITVSPSLIPASIIESPFTFSPKWSSFLLKSAKNLGCKVITVYAFSTENWTRPTKEVDFLINLFSEVLKNEIKEIHEESTKIKFIGDLSPFPKNLKEIISRSESLTKNNNKFLFNVCVNYGGRQEIVKVAKELALKSSTGEIKPSEINEELFNSELLTGGIKDPELLIRTSGEKRISNFLLWQLAYSEIYISDVLWPEFNEHEFLKAIIDYQSRNRRFGGIESLPNESFEDSQYSS